MPCDIEGGYQGKQMPTPRATPAMADKGEPATTECNTHQLLASLAASVLGLQTSISELSNKLVAYVVSLTAAVCSQ